jgi:NAD+ synthase
MIKCKFCNSETVEIPDFETATDYGDFHYVCKNCGAVGYEVLGHGMVWEEENKKFKNRVTEVTEMDKKLNPKYVIPKMKDFLKEKGIERVVIGISGGKDSTIVAKLMADCLGKENVLGVLMPNGIQKDINDSKEVVKFLDIPNITVNIGRSFNALYEDMSIGLISESKRISEDARINIAPRIRMSVLYAVAQSMGNGWRVAGTTNKSEEYIGWLTKWGDGAADFEPVIDYTVRELLQLGVNLGLPKDKVYKVPIDGLAVGSDEERFGFTYNQLDDYIEKGTSCDREVDTKITRMHKYSEHKRVEIPKFRF